jgi:Kef-type K+ transport system membrane component KefB
MQRSTGEKPSSSRPYVLGYVLMLVVAVGSFFAVRSMGMDLTSAGEAPPAPGPSANPHAVLHVLLSLLVVIAASRLLGALFRRIGQPAVIGEVVAGIALGPSLLGRLSPGLEAYLFPPNIAPLIGILANVGIIVFMFLVGLELDTSVLRKRTHAALAVSHASIVAPFMLGAALALWIYPTLAPRGVRFDVFALFMGVAMSITAFPVLARILTDRGMSRTHLGVLALSCAAVDDVTAWCLLALLVGVANSATAGALLTFVLTVVFIGAMFAFVRPVVRRITAAQEMRKEVGRDAVALVLGGLLLSALVAEYIGIHAIFGAFLVGALIPHDSLLARTVRYKLEDLVVVLLLPAFFAFTGLRTQIGLVSGTAAWATCAVIILLACLGKIGGSYLAARLSDIPQREALSLGVLMNTRGLMELVVLNVGLDLGVISPALFAMMVLMAVVTTFLTSPLLSLLTPEREAEGASLGNPAE